MTPDDIPTAITKLVYTAPLIPDGGAGRQISQNQAAEQLAHYWPAIAEHFAQLLLDQNPDRDADFSAGVDWAADTIRNQA
jgi:hypothetical protein